MNSSRNSWQPGRRDRERLGGVLSRLINGNGITLTKKLAASFLFSTAAVTSADAQDGAKARIAPAEVYQVAPALGKYTDDLLFGDNWKRTELAPRDRSIVTVSALIAMGRIAQVRSHVSRALDNGVSPGEIGEIITHLAFYSGWPNAISAVFETKKVFDAKGIGDQAEADVAPLELDPVSEAARAATVARMVAPTTPELADVTDRVLFGDLWRRATLSTRDRSLVTMAALIAMGQPEQLAFHVERALDNGLTRSEAAEVPTHLAYYAGWPRAMSAIPVLERVFEARAGNAAPEMQAAGLSVLAGEAAETFAGAAEHFSGAARVGPLFSTDAPARLGGGVVQFEAGARTAWHTHPLGQTLYITSGCGWVQSEGGSVREVRPGDIVQIPPNVRHWHGASAGTAMTHLAVAESLDGKVVTWMEHVSEEDYARGASSDAACAK